MKKTTIKLSVLIALGLASQASLAGTTTAATNLTCSAVPTYAQLKAALVTARAKANGGFNLDMWGTVVNRDGVVCAVAYTGTDRFQQWPGSRIIAAQKAYTANAFSLPGLALSTANLYTAVQPGGSLFGLQHSNPVDATTAYEGATTNSKSFGTATDPLVNHKIGGINVFGGGLALYSSTGALVGAVGVSGDSSCADHNIAWETRHALALDYVPNGVSGDTTRPDNIVYDYTPATGLQIGKSASGWGHPACSTSATSDAAALNVVPVR